MAAEAGLRPWSGLSPRKDVEKVDGQIDKQIGGWVKKWLNDRQER